MSIQLCLPSPWCCTVIWYHSYRIKMIIPRFPNKIAHHHISKQRSVFTSTSGLGVRNLFHGPRFFQSWHIYTFITCRFIWCQQFCVSCRGKPRRWLTIGLEYAAAYMGLILFFFATSAEKLTELKSNTWLLDSRYAWLEWKSLMYVYIYIYIYTHKVAKSRYTVHRI
jgi:hypothetical protein